MRGPVDKAVELEIPLDQFPFCGFALGNVSDHYQNLRLTAAGHPHFQIPLDLLVFELVLQFSRRILINGDLDMLHDLLRQGVGEKVGQGLGRGANQFVEHIILGDLEVEDMSFEVHPDQEVRYGIDQGFVPLQGLLKGVLTLPAVQRLHDHSADVSQGGGKAHLFVSPFALEITFQGEDEAFEFPGWTDGHKKEGPVLELRELLRQSGITEGFCRFGNRHHPRMSDLSQEFGQGLDLDLLVWTFVNHVLIHLQEALKTIAFLGSEPDGSHRDLQQVFPDLGDLAHRQGQVVFGITGGQGEL